MNNLSICEENCDFGEYNYITKKVKCSCFTKINLPLISEIKIDKEKLISNFKDIRNIGNFKMLNCYKLFLNKKNIFINLSNYMLIILLFLELISIYVFTFYNHKKIQDFIINKKKNDKKIIFKNMVTSNNERNQIGNDNKSSYFDKKRKIKIKKKKHKRIKFEQKIPYTTKSNDNSKRKINLFNILSFEEKIINIEKLETINDLELNQLDYEQALKKDKRNFLRLYISLIKTKHFFIFSFFNLKDYNSQMIKIFIFFFTFAMNLIVSAMFYSDSTMHQIYIENGAFNFTYQLPQMIYSFIISTILENLLNILGLYEKDIIKLKNNKKSKEKVLLKIKIKLIIFFIVAFVLLFFFWFYLGCFCAVYKNTQIHLLIDVLSSFSFSFITPFFVILFPSIFRIISLNDKNDKKPILFKFSNFLINF